MDICQKSTRDIIKKSHWNYMTSYQNVIAEKNGIRMANGRELSNDTVYKCDIRPLLKSKSVSWTCRGRVEAVSITAVSVSII